MPNRVIKESIRTSRSVGALTDFDFRLWIYLITYVDDFGRGSADPELLKGVVYTRRKSVTEGQIYEGIARLASAGMIHLYTVDGEPYLYFPNWASHQRIQTKKSRFPSPPENHGDSPWKTVDEKNPPPESESKTNTNIHQEQEDARARETIINTPFGDISVDPLIVKIQKELTGLTDRHYSLLNEYRQSLGDDLISHAIDEAVGNGSRSWSYVERILVRYERENIRTVGEAKSAEEKYRSERRTKPDGNHRGNLRQDGLRDAQRALREQYADKLGTI